MFGSPSMDPHSVSSAMPLKAHSTPNARLGSKESEVGGLPVSTWQKTNDKSQQFLFFGMPVKPQSTPDTRVSSKEYSGSDLPGSTAEKTPRKTIVPRRPRSADRRLGPSMSSLNISRSSENLKTDRTTEIGTDMKTKWNQDTKGDENSATEIESRIAADSAPKPGDDIYKAARSIDFDYRVFTPSGGAPSSLEQPAANLDARPPSDKTKPSPYVFGSDVNQPAGNESRLPFKFEGVENTASMPHANESDLKPPAPNQDVRPTGQYGRPASSPPNPRATGVPLGEFTFRAAPPTVHRQEASLPVKSPDRNFPHELSPRHGEGTAPPSKTSPRNKIPDWKASPDLLSSRNNPRSNAATSDLRMEDKTANLLFQPETPVRPGDSDRTQSTGAIRTEKRGPQPSSTPRPLSTLSTAVDRPSSAPPNIPTTPIPAPHIGNRTPLKETDEEGDEFDEFDDESSGNDFRQNMPRSPSLGNKQESVLSAVIQKLQRNKSDKLEESEEPDCEPSRNGSRAAVPRSPSSGNKPEVFLSAVASTSQSDESDEFDACDDPEESDEPNEFVKSGESDESNHESSEGDTCATVPRTPLPGNRQGSVSSAVGYRSGNDESDEPDKCDELDKADKPQEPVKPDKFSDESSKDDSGVSVPQNPSIGHEQESASNIMVCSPSRGRLEVNWSWMTTSRAEKMDEAADWIVQSLFRALNPRDTWAGHIYAFKVKNSQGEGFVKIGATEREIEERMKEHEICYGGCELVYPSGPGDFVPLNHVYCVERLIHAELVNRAVVLEKCPGPTSHNSHKEWFDVKEEDAIKVIRKWCGWISRSPYEEKLVNPVRSPHRTNGSKQQLETPPTSKWQLKPAERNISFNLCWSLETPSEDSLAITRDIEDIVAETARVKLSDQP